MSGKIAYVFPGQGSQTVGMGKDLYDASDVARAVFEEADSALGFPISRVCFDGPEEDLQQTVNSQPAIMTVSVASLKAALKAAGEDGLKPDYVAGHSLGEYCALVAAEAFEFADAVRLVYERGRLMHEAGLVRPGGMAAIIGLDETCVAGICFDSGVEIANINSPAQIVVSGPKDALTKAVEIAKGMGARHAIELKVSGAFHSSLMEPVVEGMTKAISSVKFRDPKMPVVVNTSGKVASSAEEVKAELIWQLCNSVQWNRSVEFMIESGVTTFIEIGPGRVLSGLIRRIDRNVNVLHIDSIKSLHRGVHESVK
ncbi:MAG: ACP S-malonyltransferase [Chloroflexi bacterium]|jgi:[acyl-carrier-protein] S-malonyltransferase|nr:ACP S-malonyltransferase [Chloroflexota bacterium]MBT7081353.1 ACP S-malonyltransferase [Chloroflexota bacterium]MBT7290661.1 ACP S-malonyltransferase [Chloroflexota bacterium]